MRPVVNVYEPAGVTVRVVALDSPPTISGFAATPASIAAGQSTVLNATLTGNVSSLTLDGVLIAGLPVTVSPNADRVYTLIATGPGGSATATLQVSVQAAAFVPVITSKIVNQTPANIPADLSKSAIVLAEVFGLSGQLLTIGFNDFPGQAYTRGEQAVELTGQTTANPQGIGTTNALAIYAYAPNLLPQCTAQFMLTAAAPGSSAFPVGAPAVIGPSTSHVRSPFDHSQIAEGWYWAGVNGLPAPWNVLEYPVYIRHAAIAQPQALMPAVVGSFTVAHDTGRYARTMVPTGFAPTEVPLPQRDYPAFPGVPTNMNQFAYTMLVPLIASDAYEPSVLPSGLWTTHCRAMYFADDYTHVDAPWPLREGPRGRGTLTCVTSIVETDRPTGGKCIGTQSWNVWACGDDGTIRVLAGDVDDPNTPPYTNFDPAYQQRAPARRIVVGDFTGIPAGHPRRFHELWDVARVPRTLAIDTSQPPIGNPPENPHFPPPIGGPRMLVTDTKNSRICDLRFPHNQRREPGDFSAAALGQCVVTEFATNLNSPWGCAVWAEQNQLVATDSVGNVVIGYDLDSKAVVWSVPFTRPEGIRILNGVAYIGSLASKAVYKMDLATRAVVKVIDVPADGNSRFVNLAVSDGSFLPLGSVATATWSNTQFGWPCVFGPDGTRLKIGYRANFWGDPKGTWVPGLLEYVPAVSIGKGRMTWGTMQRGLHRLSAALPTDTVVDPMVPIGAQKWIDNDLKIPYGDYGYGSRPGVSLPWGHYGPEVDALLVNVGHTKP